MTDLVDAVPVRQRPAAYRWQCLICEASNAAADATCCQCGFPARATGSRIAAAKAGRSASPDPSIPLPTTSARTSLADLLAPLHPARRIVAVVGIVLAFVGGIGLKVMVDWRLIGESALLFVIGFAVFVVALAGTERTARQ